MKRLSLRGQTVAYYEQNPNIEECILFIHGNSFSSECFQKQFSSPSLKSYRLIALDLPGHGHSDHLADKSLYTLPYFASVVAEFIDALKLQKVLIAGHSLGGHIALETKVNCRGILIWATPPLSNPPDFTTAYVSDPDVGLFFKEELQNSDTEKLLNLCFNASYDRDKFSAVIRATDPKVRATLLESVGRLEFRDEIEVLKTASIPLAIGYGVDDRVVAPAYFPGLAVPQRTVALPGGHNCHLEEAQEFNSFLSSFALEAFGAKA